MARPKEPHWFPTMNLRFERRLASDDGTTKRYGSILQQEWWCRPTDDETVGKREWRDVPMVGDMG